jgi:hypothetical protein
MRVISGMLALAWTAALLVPPVAAAGQDQPVADAAKARESGGVADTAPRARRCERAAARRRDGPALGRTLG